MPDNAFDPDSASRSSVWNVDVDPLPAAPRPSLSSADVAVVGGGLTGLLTAWELHRRGQSVVVLEAGRVGASNTGNSTGNLYATVSGGLAAIHRKWGAAATREIVALRREAVDRLEALAATLDASVQFRRVPLQLAVSRDPPALIELDAELEACAAAGLPMAEATAEFPFPVARALRLKGQAQCNPRAFATALARRLREQGVAIHEHARVLDADAGEGRLTLAGGEVRAPRIVFATHTPKGFNLVQAEMEVQREYGVALEGDAALPPGIFWVRDDARSLRQHRIGQREYLVVVGEKHKTGTPARREPHDALADYARLRWNLGRVAHRWSAQQFAAADLLPYIGRSAHDNVYVATGFAADGLTWGAVAAPLLAALALGETPVGADLLSPRRFTPVKSAAGWGRENAGVVKHLTLDYLKGAEGELDRLSPGEGRIVELDGHQRAVYRDADGALAVLSCVCPHLKCKVAWNAVDRTWDCPCHGSRFDGRGRVLEGPAWTDLERIERGAG